MEARIRLRWCIRWFSYISSYSSRHPRNRRQVRRTLRPPFLSLLFSTSWSIHDASRLSWVSFLPLNLISPAINLIDVQPLRLGKSYQTYCVRASQDGNNIFTLTASFAQPEPSQPKFSIKPPADIPPPEECELSEDRWQRFLDKYHSKLDSKLSETIIARIDVSFKFTLS